MKVRRIWVLAIISLFLFNIGEYLIPSDADLEVPRSDDPSGSRSDGTGGRNIPTFSMFKGNPQRTGCSDVNTSSNPGMVKWIHYPDDLGSWIWASPVIGPDGTIYYGSYNHFLYAAYPNGTEKWKFETGEKISSTPAVDTDGNIYFTSWDGYLYSIFANGTERWKQYMPGVLNNDFYCSPVIDPDYPLICWVSFIPSHQKEGRITGTG